MFRNKVQLLCLLAGVQLVAAFPALGQFSPTAIMSALQNRPSNLTLVSSHRGEINGPFANNMPENSIGSGMNAVYAGMEMIEVDVFTTQDHVPYLMHDRTLYRMLNLKQPAAYQATKAPAPNWSAIQGLPLCAGRGQVTPSYTCTAPSPAQTAPSLSSFVNTIGSAKAPGFSNPWGGVIQLDIRDRDSLLQSWLTLLSNPYVNDQVIFKFSPARLQFTSVNDLISFLATAPYYNGNTNQVISDMQNHMNFMAVYQTEAATESEAKNNDPNWAIHNWQSWAAASSNFHRNLSPMVGVKGNPGKFVGSSDPLYVNVSNGSIPGGGNSLNTVGVYSTYYECYNAVRGPKNLPNQPTNPYYNGFYSNEGKCAVLLPNTADSADGIDHRYDYTFISGTLNFGMIIADTAGELVNYLLGKSLRHLEPIRGEVAAPKGLSYNHTGQTTAEVSWSDPNVLGSSVPTFTVALWNQSSGISSAKVVTVMNPSYIFTGLSSGQTWVAEVQETLDGITSNWSSPITVSTVWSANPLPGLDYSNCANEGEECGAATGTNYLAFGAGTKYNIYPATFGGSYSDVCSVSNLGGIDPNHGTSKSCSAGNQSPYHNLTACASEGGSCTAGSNGAVIYFDAYLYSSSMKTNYEAIYLQTLTANQTITCSTPVFGDPADGTAKKCYLYNFSNGSTSWNAQPFPNYYNCANEGGSCPTVNADDYSNLAFGFQNQYVIQRYNSNAGSTISCSTGQFGDPYDGKFKSCSTGNVVPTQYTQCATEGGTCTTGANGGIVYFLYVNNNSSNGVVQTIYVHFNQYGANQQVSCNDSTFGDPSSGNSKTCFLQNF